MTLAPHSNSRTLPCEPELAQLERRAVRLARAAGARILSAAESRAFAVHFKPPETGHAPNSNPVSDARIVWAVDPIDGTMGGANRLGERWDRRVLGSATLELAFTAAGLTELAHLSRPRLWDAVAGLVLLRAAGCAALAREEDGWRPFEAFAGDLVRWSRPLLAGDESALQDAVRLLFR